MHFSVIHALSPETCVLTAEYLSKKIITSCPPEMQNPRSTVHVTVNALILHNNGIQQFSICMTGAHRGVSGLQDIHLPSPPLVLLGSPQAILPARYLKIFCHSTLRDHQNPTWLSQDMPASSPPSIGVLCTPSVGMRLPN